ncbi:MAG: NnrS family protein [Burkholderiales bacterium]
MKREPEARRIPAHEAFYPAAALYAALALPASVIAMTGGAGAVPALANPAAHAHEMLLGYALAVVAGNQLGVARGRFIVALLLLWTAARASFLLAPASLLAGVLNAAFAGALAFRVVPRLFGSAKKLRNQALPAVLAALCAAAAAWQFARYASDPGVPRALILATVMLFALLMLFMGGRILAAAVAGQLQRQGERLDARVQPRLEAALLIAGAIAAGALLAPGLQAVAATAAAMAGTVAALRLARWRLWAVRGRPDLLCLAAGYGWLAAGLLALSVSIAVGRFENAALHLITIGALGTLTFNVMVMSWRLKARRALAGHSAVVLGTGLLAAATVLRLLGAFHPEGPWLLVAAGCWSSAFALLIALFWRNRRRN